MNSVLVFVLGLAGGSFINALEWRLYRGKKTVWDRSQCIRCGHKLGVWDLIPVASFLALGGRCRYCRKKISWQYPAVELASGLGLYYLALNFPPDLFIWLAGIFLITVFIFVYDLKYLLIPHGAVFLGTVWALAGLRYFDGDFLTSVLSAALMFSFFFLPYYLSKGKWMGGGDSKLGLFLGLWLGWPLVLEGLLMAYVLGTVIGLALIFFKRATLKSKMPFGPFLIIGAWVAYMWGETILVWYENILLM
ncbi:MAG: prepilin peptidase [Parcubacteria group bacterium]|nr:prepilin peptidase [Parcubacteria group bacterium]